MSMQANSPADDPPPLLLDQLPVEAFTFRARTYQ
ncbi:hypothetical protein PtrM4_130090 [Pyrenophora tritici-repentis]|uniref:Uncharacterized protein n=1 Tax=Pyrenophora tritici-repentis TaxID=45151 RepID=A0A834RRC4_9PLEO|nr:hypothetical protein PtrM4_130090 [Pyrenophora tritici-repentis]KAI1507317.1 hypothetical protein Ptr86124_013761 [Pyrenophora tritici-repentis]KAI1669320.1 hypothetical protein L13192_06779 [Pyrenophora tritici-repentis]KAI1683796.1 hypothetical protein KJE20_06301 [Pyrenophora tritici-repentis]